MAPLRPQTQPLGGAESLEAQRYGDALAEARGRTLDLVATVADADLNRVHDPLMSPLVWDLGHIAAFEDLWLCQRAGGLKPLRGDLAEVYDAAETPRAHRGELPYLRRDEAIDFMEAVRERALGVLERADTSADGDRLNAHGFVWEMLVQHEHQHNETMLQTLQLAQPGTFEPVRSAWPAPAAGRDWLPFASGPFLMGDQGDDFAYDNERPRHEVELAAFEIGAAPVTNGEYREFVADGGYSREGLWSEEGWRWRRGERSGRPLFWNAEGEERRFQRVEPIDPGLPVMHVSWFEADAFARWRGERLPTEAEWERAAAGDERRGHLDQLKFGPGPAGPFIGDCWEWTADRLEGYPGFRAFPYREYSEVFFGGDYRVLRGGSWASRPSVARHTFRNWDHPQRRQLFAGFRCARDA